jgi:hypothetical protein
MSDDETIGLVLGLVTLCCCCSGLLAATGAGLFFFLRRRQPRTGGSGSPAASSSPHTDPAPPDAVRQALLALNRTSTPKPYVVRLDGDKVVCEWNIVDAKWLEAIEAKGLNKDYKLEITLDESTHTARFLEIETKSEGSVGAGGASFQKEFFAGQNLVKKEFEISLGPGGGYAYAFDIGIVKNDARQAIRSVGWIVQ